MTQPRPFSFDTEFDGEGTVIASRPFTPVKRSYLAAEVDALVATARAEAREAALAEAESMRAMALSTIAQAVAQGAPALAAVAQSHRQASAELALAAAKVLSAGALQRFPVAPIREALDALGQELDASPRLAIAAAGLDDETRAAIGAVCEEAGFQGIVSLRDEPGLAPAAFVLEWADGRAEYDPAATAERVAAALNAALAAEHGHGDTLSPEGAL